MKQKMMLIFCLIFSMSALSFAQSPSVTNADLEKYRQERLRADKEYRENYAKLGFPSPEELDRERKESLIEAEKLAAKLRAERLEQERVDAYREAASAQATTLLRQRSYFDGFADEPSYFWSFGYGGRHRRFRHQLNQPGIQNGYFAGGQFWPTPVVKPQRPSRWLRRR
jgi:hypothetical protein